MYGLERFASDAIGVISTSLMQFRVIDIIDILLVALMIYAGLMLTKDTRALQVIKGLGFLLVGTFLAQVFSLQSVAWLLGEVVRMGAIALIIIFQPELRRALEQIGRGNIFQKAGLLNNTIVDLERIADEVVITLENLASRRVGALIIIERHTGLGDIIATGTKIEGVVSAPLLENIFEPNTPLHDGAVVIRERLILGAGCFLPLSDNSGISRQLGTRHRAALGVSEISDCLAFVVSEETGVISVAAEGKLTRYLDAKQIRSILDLVYSAQLHEQSFKRRRKKKKDSKINE